ncbi:hypothetical protein L3X38_025019 [Prunus dulcis]|uniref:Uncharacterized protein n=1 Tax=Prunus dulcis TaxID=3755 RepID=A0AAD4W1Q4_PRUDU|nr:hypothetical protein L3X38_025019 [Prunus dulcis]
MVVYVFTLFHIVFEEMGSNVELVWPEAEAYSSRVNNCSHANSSLAAIRAKLSAEQLEQCHTPDRLRRSKILSPLGLATFSPARKDLFLGAHGATSQGVTHPGIAPASNSLNFGVPTNPKPVSPQKASSKFRVAQRTAQLHLARYCPLWHPRLGPHGFVPGSSRSNFPGGHPSWDCSSLQLA